MPKVIEVNVATGESIVREASEEEITKHERERRDAVFETYMMDGLPVDVLGMVEHDMRLAFDLGMNVWERTSAYIHQTIPSMLPNNVAKENLAMFASIVALKEIQMQAQAELEAFNALFKDNAARAMDFMGDMPPAVQRLVDDLAENDPIFREMLGELNKRRRR